MHRLTGWSIFRISFAALAALILLVVSQSTGSVSAATPGYADPGGTCAGLTPCHTTIQDAVSDAGPGASDVFVFPGTYDETVDISATPASSISLATVDATGSPMPGTVTIAPGTGRAINTTGLYGGDVTLNGFTVASPDNDGIHLDAMNVTLANLTASNNGDNGIFVNANGSIAVSDSTANDSGGGADPGFELIATVDVTVTNSIANGNSHGFDIEAPGDVNVTNTTSNDNAGEGFEIDTGGDARLERVTANGNGDDGVDIECFELEGCEDRVDSAIVLDSIFMGNGSSGVDFDGDGDHHEPGGFYAVQQSIICQNTTAGFSQNSDIVTFAGANWWGHASGPEHPNNATPGTGDKVLDGANPTDDDGQGLTAGTAHFGVWVAAIVAEGGAATQGQPTVVRFGFPHGANGFNEGPGDPNGAPTFTASTDNGVVTTSGFVSSVPPEGFFRLEVTLIPENAGTATVTVTGPCGLDDTLAGNNVVLNVAAAPVEPTAPPAELPASGGAASDGGSGSLPWLAALAGIVGASLVAGGWYARRRWLR